MPENALLDAIEASLGAASLTPAPGLVGPAEPAQRQELPAVVVSLASSRRAGSGLGPVDRVVEDVALPLEATIDLADAFLPGEPDFPLWDPAERRLVLPHGGLVRSDLSVGALGAGDLSVRIDGGAPLAVVQTAPAAGEVSPDAVSGQLVFGDLPAADAVVSAAYFVGQWTQRRVRILGQFGVDVLAAASADVRALSSAVTGHLLDPARRREAAGPLSGLLAVELTQMGAIGRPEPVTQGRRRSLAFAFEFEHQVNEAPSGGIIDRVPIESRVRLTRVEAGVITEEVAVEASG